MSFSKLQKLTIHKRQQTAGKPPALEWLPLSQLGVDDEYQRPMTKRGLLTIAKIADNFRWCRFSPVIVTRVGPDQYAVIDGQHRATAALSQGFERVPAYIVAVNTQEAAQVFAAVNGIVTPMSAQAVFKAARAGGEAWALEINGACNAAGVTPRLYPVPKKKMNPGDTLAVGSLRNINHRHGTKQLAAILRFLMGFSDTQQPGNITAAILRRANMFFTGRPDWVASIEEVIAACHGMGFLICTDEQIEKAIRKRVGDGRASPEAKAALRDRVRDLHGRKFSTSMIATTLRVPYADIERAISELAT